MDLLEINTTDLLMTVDHELRRAMQKHPSTTNSAHHHWAVLREEVDEMWDAIKADHITHAKQEAVQVAAMAIRFLLEVP